MDDAAARIGALEAAAASSALEAGAAGLAAQRLPSPWLPLGDAIRWNSAIAEGAGAGEIEGMLVVAPSAPSLL